MYVISILIFLKIKDCHIITYFFRAGLNELYATPQKNLDVEMKLGQHLEQKIKVMRRLKEENEVCDFGREREKEGGREGWREGGREGGREGKSICCS